MRSFACPVGSRLALAKDNLKSDGRKRAGEIQQRVSVMDNKLFVGNLAWGATEEDLQKYFTQFGTVQQVEVMRDRFTNRARGFAFVTMGTAEEAQKAANGAEGQDFVGRPLKVNIARPREERPEREGGRSFDGPRGGGGGDRGGFRPRRPFGGGGESRGGGGGFGDRPRRSFSDRSPRRSNDRGGDRGGHRGGSDRGGFEGGFQEQY